MIRAFVSLKTQFENLGDALINRELINLASARVDTTVDLTRSPASFHRTMGLDDAFGLRKLNGFRGSLFVELIKARLAGDTCYFFLNPGGLGGGVGDSFKTLLKSHVYNLALLSLKSIGVRICQVGVSYEKMAWKEVSVAKLRRLACYNFSVRDRESYDYLRELRIGASEVVPDLSFNLYRLARDEIVKKKYAAAFSFRADRGNGMAEISGFVRKVIQANDGDSRFLLISQVRRDSILMKEIHDELVSEFGADRIDFGDCHNNFDDAFKFYDRCRLLYSNRLHSLLLASYAHSIPVGVVNSRRQRKIAALFSDLDISENLCEITSNPSSAIKPIDRGRFVQESDKLNDYFDRLLHE